MTKINHPKFGNLNDKDLTPGNAVEPKVHTVMSPEDEEQAFMAQMSQIANQATPEELAASMPLMDDAVVQKEAAKREALDKLVLFKQPHYKEVKVAGVNFRLKLLNAHENAKVYQMVRELSPEEQLTKSSVIMLAASLVDAGGVKIEDTYSGPPMDDVITMKYYELCTWNMPVINALVSAYTKFQNEVEADYSKDFFDKSPTTPTTD